MRRPRCDREAIIVNTSKLENSIDLKTAARGERAARDRRCYRTAAPQSNAPAGSAGRPPDAVRARAGRR